ncbi:conserved exported hypothetical protein [uncultured Alphaproteobacteria bacterium]|uniref:Divergent polysaccharide deacetylase family protein n=1 Tax=uncultured Alphaproteobacteria bacterium TaxID=91750 RepID=A0A212J7S7_9PROT|nr:conserved exported hypothetical protein [uncultured Alphaproteobacteria bacterium]
MVAGRTRRGRKSGGKAGFLRRLTKGSAATALVAVAVFAALMAGASIGWWGASHFAEKPAPRVVHREPPLVPAPAPPPAATPAPEPEVAALPPPALPAPAQPGWRRNAIAFVPEPGKPMIAIVIDDMGIDVKRSARIIALPPPLTTSFLSYAHNLATQARAAHAAGHELMLHMPMEPFGTGYDPGPDVLLTAMSDDAIRARLRQSLASFSGYVGINNHMGSRFTADERGMHAVMDVLKGDGLLFLDSLTSARSVGVKIAGAERVPNLVRNVFLDDSPDPAAIREQLRRVEEHARRTGSAIAIGHPRETTLDALAEWLPAARAKGFQFVPISALAKAKYGQ